MPLNNMDAREVTMHYKRKGDRVDEVLHDIVLKHVNRLEHENKRLREGLENVQNQLFSIRGLDKVHDSEITGLCIEIRKALEGEDIA